MSLTEKAQKLIQRNIEERYRWVDQLSEKLTAEQSQKVVEALNIMTQAARELEAESSDVLHTQFISKS